MGIRKPGMMNSNFYPLNTMRSRPVDEEEERRRRAEQSKPVVAMEPAPTRVRLAAQGGNMWGDNGSCLGLKILCGALGLVIVVLIVVLVIKMVAHKKGPVTGSASPSQDSELPMSLQGGFHFGDESLMSTSI